MRIWVEVWFEALMIIQMDNTFVASKGYYWVAEAGDNPIENGADKGDCFELIMERHSFYFK